MTLRTRVIGNAAAAIGVSSETTDFDEEYTTTDLQLPADMPGFDDDYEAIVAKVDDLFKVEEKTTAREDVEETMTTCKKDFGDEEDVDEDVAKIDEKTMPKSVHM